MKKKYSVPKKDKKDWVDFTKNPAYVYDKDSVLIDKYEKSGKIKKLDLHGFTLSEANKKVKRFIIQSQKERVFKAIIITGKGLRSQVYDDPYRSEKMNVLKNSIPEYIKSDEELTKKVDRISVANIKDGGEGAFYIFFKNFKE